MPRIDRKQTLYCREEAERLAMAYRENDPEWEYRVVVGDPWCWVDVYDEDGELVASKI